VLVLARFQAQLEARIVAQIEAQLVVRTEVLPRVQADRSQ
jgi:hypothetical protein